MGAVAKFLTLVGVMSVGSYMIYQTMGRLEVAALNSPGEVKTQSPEPDRNHSEKTDGILLVEQQSEPQTVAESANWESLPSESASSLTTVSETASASQPHPLAFPEDDSEAHPGLDFRAPVEKQDIELTANRMPADEKAPIQLVAGEQFFDEDVPAATKSQTNSSDPFAVDPPTEKPTELKQPAPSSDFFFNDVPPANNATAKKATAETPAQPVTKSTSDKDFFDTDPDPFAADTPVKSKPAETKTPSLPDFPELEPATAPAKSSTDDPFGEDPLPVKKPVSNPAPSLDDFPALDKAAKPPARVEPAPFEFEEDLPKTTTPAETTPSLDFPALDTPASKPSKPSEMKTPAETDPFATDFPALEEKPKQPATVKTPAESDPFANDFPPVEKTPKQPAANEKPLPTTLDEFPALETPASKKPAEDAFPAFDETPAMKNENAKPTEIPADFFDSTEKPATEAPKKDVPLTLDELTPLEEKPEFPGFQPEPKPEMKPAESNDLSPTLELPGDPITEKKPVEDKPAVADPTKTPPPEINVVTDPTMPSLEDLKGDGTLTPETPRGKLLPQLEIQKQAPQSALLNKPFVYTIIVKNVGKSAAEDVTVQDQIPRGTNLTGTIPQAEMIGKRLVWKLGHVEPGEEKKIAVRVVPVEPGPIGSVATVNFVAEVGAETIISDAAISMKVDGPSEAKVGEVVNFQFRIRNDSRQTLTGLVLRDIIPEGLHHPAGADLENPLGELPPGREIVETLEMKVVQPGTLVNRAILTANGGLEIEAEAALNAGGNKLTITRSGPKQRFVGRAAIYQNVVTNTSNETIENAVVVEQIPEGMEFVSASSAGQFHPASRSIFWKVPVLEPGQSLTLQAKLSPQQAGELRSVVKVIEQNANEIQTVSHTTVQSYSALGVELTEYDRTFGVGEKVILRIDAMNRGNEAAENVAVRAKIPPTMQLMAVRGNIRYRIEGREVVFEPMHALQPGTNELIELELQAAQPSRAQVAVNIQSNRMDQPMTRETAVQIVGSARR